MSGGNLTFTLDRANRLFAAMEPHDAAHFQVVEAEKNAFKFIRTRPNDNDK